MPGELWKYLVAFGLGALIVYIILKSNKTTVVKFKEGKDGSFTIIEREII